MPIKRKVEKTLGSLSLIEKSIYWILFFMPYLFFSSLAFLEKRKEHLRGNDALRRQEQTVRSLIKGLKSVDEGNNFLTEAQLRIILEIKLMLVKALTPLDLDRVLSSHRLGPETLKEIKNLLQDFESAQY